jgi:translation initiation factor 2 beta subunit (eIF-2beta)/eIF-5
LEFREAFRKQNVPSERMVQKTQEFCTMTQGAMRVEEYERHFMKMMRYAPEDTNLEQKKRFWFLRGLHRGLRQGLKASEHKTLRHLMNCAIALKDERSHEGRT